MRFLILGNGSSGRAAKGLAERLGHETTVLDGEEPFPADGRFDAAVVSPGIPLDHPWQTACRVRGIPAKSELQFGCEVLRRRGVRLLAVTGSKGKSSVVKLVADALTRAGRRAVPCGNYGTPVCEVAQEAEDARRETGDAAEETRDESWAVVEVSSFQLETTELPPDTFEAAAILNLQEDHLDRHGGVEVYHALKRNLLRFAKSGLNCGEETTGPRQQEKGSELLAGSYFDNEILRPNGAAAIFLLRAAGLDDAAIAAAFAAFEPLPHRMNVVGTFCGITCIDDSKATSLAALAAGVRMAASASPLPKSNNPTIPDPIRQSDNPTIPDPIRQSNNPTIPYPIRQSNNPTIQQSNNPPPPARIRLIAGGLPKGDDPKSVLGDLTARVKKVYLMGQSAELFFAAWSGSVACEICGTMDRAVKAAMREAESGETVLLSPGTASFDQFKSFGERGDVFADLVQKEGTDK